MAHVKTTVVGSYPVLPWMVGNPSRLVLRDAVMAVLRRHGLSRISHVIGRPNGQGCVEVWRDARSVFSAPLHDLQRTWDEVSWRIARLRDEPQCADAEHAAAGRGDDSGLHVHLTFDPTQRIGAPFMNSARPKLAILREQGVNSQVEMSFAMHSAGFETFDVHMSDLQAGRVCLEMYQGLVACGGFSYGDTLGAGEGWLTELSTTQLRELVALRQEAVAEV